MRWLFRDVVNDVRQNCYLVFGPRDRLMIQHTAIVNNAQFNMSSGSITIDEYVFFGHNVTLLTGRHDLTKFDRERQQGIPSSGCNIVVRRGAWIASNALVIGPCEIGEHSVVAAGSVVTRDVPPYSVVAGNPAKVIRKIAESDPQQGVLLADDCPGFRDE